MKHFVIHKYSDGAEVTCEWDLLYDGPWTQKEDSITVTHNHPFFIKDSGIDRN